jgi:FMN phosphatase YigB (HAD superfamily)
MKCASFDIFDTCLTRRVAAPTEVFRQVGRQIAKQTAQLQPEDFAEQFVVWRSEAERRAHRAGAREDVRLEDIWAELERIMGADAPPAGAGAALEMEIEWSVLGPIAAAQERLARERSRGLRIIFISDMYLPADFLRRCLSRHALLQEGDGLYVSSDVGLTKRSGNLFRHVLTCEQLTAAELSHWGDNAWGDRDVPRHLGISAELFLAPAPHPAEDVLLRCRPAAPGSYVDTVGRIRFARLASPPRGPLDDASARPFVEALLGPVLCLFGHWLLERARADRTERLFFVSRDARLAWAVCRKLAGQKSGAMDCRYLLVSRQAIYLPAADPISPEGMPWLKPNGEARSLSALAARLEMDPEELSLAWRRRYPSWRPEDQLDTPGHWEYFWTVLHSPEFADRLQRTIQLRRAAALAYFAEAGLLDPAPSALVDLGSLLYCQEALNRVCAERRGPARVRGYYLYLKRNRRGPAEAGPAEALGYEGAPDLPAPESLAWLQRTSALEHIIGIADHPSVCAYEPDGRPSFVAAPPTIPSARFQALEAALLDYVEVFGDCWRPLAADPAAAGMLGTLINAFLAQPPPSALAFLREVSFPVDQEHRQVRPLFEPISWAEIARDFWPRRNGRRQTPERIWPEADLQSTSRPRRYAGRAAKLARQVYAKLGIA